MGWYIIKYRTDGLVSLCETLKKYNLINDFLIPIIKDAERKSGERFAYFNYAFVDVDDPQALKNACVKGHFPISFYIGDEVSIEKINEMCEFIDCYNDDRVDIEKFKVGEIVTIYRGSFANFTGPIVSLGNNNCIIKLHIMNRDVKVTLPYKNLDP